MRNSFILIFLLFAFKTVHAQVESGLKTPPGVLPIKSDTSIHPSDSLSTKPDSLNTKKNIKSDIETTINYSARDSIFSSLDNKMIWLYGDAKVKYGEIELEAEEIVIDYINNTVSAHGVVDSLGRVQGHPIFKNGSELYETKDIVYNFKSKRARISEVVTKQGDAYLQGEAVFKNEKGELLSIRNSYTTCNLEHPHYRIRATKTKAIPNDKIVAGPFYFEFNEIPLPIGFLFGMFPSERKSKSGIIFPSYGESRARGFNLRNGGYYFDINDYIKLALTADIYSKGGHALYARTNYISRYHYSGSASLSFSRLKSTEFIEAPTISNDFNIAWSHTPQSKGNSRFAASVSAASSTYNKNNNLNTGLLNQNSTSSLNPISANLSSNISYSKKLQGTPFSLGVNMSGSENLIDKIVTLQLPSLSLNMTNLYPFKSSKGKTGPLDNLSVGYSLVGRQDITNNLGRVTTTAINGEPITTAKDSIAKFNTDNLGLFLKNAHKGIKHTVPLSYSFKMFKFFTMSPSINFSQLWYFEKLDWGTGDTPLLNPTIIKGFNTVENYSLSTALTTKLYGTYFFKRGKVKAIRHIVNPNVSFSYVPDYRNNHNYFQQFASRKAIDANGKPIDLPPIIKGRQDGFVYGSSTLGHSETVSFSLGNNLEMKVKSAKDTVARKVSLLNNLSIGSSYNVIADSFKLTPFAIAANTNVLNNLLNVNASASLDPYAYGTYTKTPVKGETTPDLKIHERRINSYAWDKGSSIGRITAASLAISTNLNPQARKKEKETRDKVGQANIADKLKQNILANPSAYIDFKIPWSLNINYNITYSHPTDNKSKVVQAVTFSGDISISEKWKTTFNSGYDFKSKKVLQYTSISISRDLHCWTLFLSWVPFGPQQSYNFTLAVKAQMLKDLKLERRKPFQDQSSL